ncbi:MAG: hypothetical protein HY074_12095 [Deltaproteobacteria bacterium]|nr:hypothetical protein [Deltaproteobacteria bacterium]
MVMYIARCKSLQEASSVQNGLRAACSTLIFSRILLNPKDLDSYNADMLRSSDAQISIGSMVFGQDQATMDDSWRILSRWVVFAVLALTALAVAGIRILNSMAHSNTQVAVLVAIFLLVFVLFAYLGSRAVETMTPERTAFWNATKWLGRGRPVVLGASEEMPDDRSKLAPNVVCFYRASDRQYRRPA